MKRRVRRVTAAVVWLWIACSATSASVVEAQQKTRATRAGGPSGKSGKVAKTPHSAAISKWMGDIEWGMTEDQVMQVFVTRLRDEYKPRLAKAPGAIEEDRIRREMEQKIKAQREGRFVFDGKHSGWDVSFLRHEYRHNQGETMIVQKDETSQNFYFFIENRLWKWYKAFNSEVFAGKTFADFASTVQAKFGPAKERVIEPKSAKETTLRWLEWQDNRTRLRAVDHTKFYGFYCLVFEERATLAKLGKRADVPYRGDEGPPSTSLVDAVTSDQDAADPNADVADRLSGKIRRRQDAPPPATGGKGGAAATGSPPSSKSPPPASAPAKPAVPPSKDPLQGVAL